MNEICQNKLSTALNKLRNNQTNIVGIYTCIPLGVPPSMEKIHHQLKDPQALYEAVKAQIKDTHGGQQATEVNDKKLKSGYMIEFNYANKCYAIIHTEQHVTAEECQQLGARLVEKRTTKKTRNIAPKKKVTTPAEEEMAEV